MLNLATIVSLVVPILIVVALDRATARLMARRRHDSPQLTAAPRRQAEAPPSPRVAGDHATADARSVA